MTKIVCLSDTHGRLPYDLPPSDITLLAGDLVPGGDALRLWGHAHGIRGSNPNVLEAVWLDIPFRAWLNWIPTKKVIAVAGNHDRVFEQAPELVPKLPWCYLQDNFIIFEGLKIYASPHQLNFCNWSFNLSEEELARKWRMIPDDTNILLLHGPPYGYGDLAPRTVTDANEQTWPGGEHIGSLSLLERIHELKQLRLCVYGHCHSGRGDWKLGEATLANVTLLDEQYKMVHKPYVFEI
jgi:Icc-related predicted phosphoesterase